jgi:DNA-binding beta-propeller fold protein YncE
MRVRTIFVAATLLIVIAGAAAASWFLWLRPADSEGELTGPPVFSLYIGELRSTEGATGFLTNWDEPSDISVVGESIYILDTGNNRILVLNHEGQVSKIIGETGESKDVLREPESFYVLEDSIYVANTGASEIVVFTLEGELIKKIPMPAVSEERESRPAGIVVLQSGDLYVSDRANNVVLRLDGNGQLLDGLHSGLGEDFAFNEPRGLTIDKFGDIYVADTLSGEVKKFSQEGRYLAEFTMKGNPSYAKPIDVAVSDDGVIFFSDNIGKLIEVFNHKGSYLDIVGLYDATRVDSPSVLKEPAGLWMVGNRLYVIDKEDGIFAFDIDTAWWDQKTEKRVIIH